MIRFFEGIRPFSNQTAYLPSYRIFHLTATSFLTSDLFQKENTLMGVQGEDKYQK
jgi:hypothetical protein